MRIAFYDTNGKTWIPYESYFDGQRVFAKTDHLSTWAIVSDMLFPDPSSSSSSFSSYEPPTGEVPPLKVEEFSVQNFRMSSRFSQKSESELSYEEFSIGNFASILRVDEEGNVWFAEHGFLNQYANDVAGEWKLGRGIAINIDHSSFKNVKNTDGKDTCSRWNVALTLLHEVVHWAWRDEDRAYSCECRCWEKNAGSCDWGNALGCSTCKTPKGGYNTCLDCC